MTLPSPPDNIPDVVDGPRKRRPTERVTDNGDPLVQKKAKTTSSTATLKATSTKTTSTGTTKAGVKTSRTLKSTSLSRHATCKDVVEPVPASRPQPLNPARILVATDGSDNGHDNGTTELINGEDNGEKEKEHEDEESEPEDDEAELGKLLVIPVKMVLLIIDTRAPYETMGRTHLCILQAYSCHYLCQ